MRKRSFSVITPTFGRDKELFSFIESVLMQEYDTALIELIIIDQNDKIDLQSSISVYSQSIRIKHIKTKIKGIAHAKNLGLRNASNEIVTFADDDSKYYPDTLLRANECFNKDPDVDIFYGKIYDREKQLNILRNWKVIPIRINHWNYHLNYNAISCFTPLKTLYFDERFGVGTRYGMGEELDYLLLAIKEKLKIYYTPDIEVWHPELNVKSMNTEKVIYYAKGYGAICKKHISLIMIWNFFVSCLFQLVMMGILLVTLKFDQVAKRHLAFRARIEGFIEFKNKN